MSASSEWFLKLREEEWNNLEHRDQMWLIELGMQAQYVETKEEENDPFYQSLKKARYKAYHAEQEYLFKKRTKSK